MHLREIARLSGLAIGTIQREVANLREAGMLIERRDGNRLYFAANRDHPIFPELQRIALKTTGLVEQLSTALDGVEGIRLAFVFGSFAKGGETADSDVDLFIIGDTGLRQIVPRLKTVAETMNREINPNVYKAETFTQKWKAGDAFITQVAEGEKLWIIGSENELAALA